MAHEMGHILHFYYDVLGGNRQTEAAKEGIADVVALAYAVFRTARTVPHDQLATQQPFTDLMRDPAHDHRLHPVFHQGQELLFSEEGSGGADERLFVPCSSSNDCSTGRLRSVIHPCGSILGAAYLHLARNLALLDFDSAVGSISEGSALVTSTLYDPIAHLNEAVAYATYMAGQNFTIEDFANGMIARFQHYANVGIISTADLARVRTALAAQCMGSASQCGQLNSPGIPYRRSSSNGSRFSDGPTQVLDFLSPTSTVLSIVDNVTQQRESANSFSLSNGAMVVSTQSGVSCCPTRWHQR
jgi:hypothetical protein